MANSVLMDVFMTGLKLVLEVEAMSHHPTSLVQCMKEAQLVWEDQELILFIINEEENEMLVELGKEIANIDGENQVVELCSIEWLLTTRFMESMTMTFLASENQSAEEEITSGKGQKKTYH
ncbi:uncharacterized protein E6C27_scaffold175G00980 [Cucumis melo var. makuwa]|uniref:Ty3-gypsy retrotransposon protein n=1 Tax=Cucumis melo var. makuwa TaxID=1194695 RepID=A0A5A7U3L7_CUCMM|nr:uncharacterized protein E6C27_scaffold175G00980 [Cucumis melo var. makuwa]